MSRNCVPGKWIDGIHADTPLAEAARRALKVRLKAVEAMLPLVTECAHEDDEHVHRLRVATRRAGAAIRIFRRCCARPSGQRRLRRGLRRLRRAASAARECDVHRALLASDIDHGRGRAAGDEGLNRVLEGVLARLADERAQAQKGILRAARRYPVNRLKRFRRRLLASPESPEDRADRRLIDAARDTLPSLLESMREAARKDLSSMDDLHALRIEGKRLRYAMEIFRPCFDEAFAAPYQSLEALQDRLGAINDSNDLAARIEEFAELAAGGELEAAPDEEAVLRAVELYRDRRRQRIEAFAAAWESGERANLFGAIEGLTAGLRGAAPPAALDVITIPAAAIGEPDGRARPEVLR